MGHFSMENSLQPGSVLRGNQHDAIAGTSYATYLAALATMQTNLDADIRAIIGQSEPVHMLIFQTAGANSAATLATVADIRRAQFDFVNSATRLVHFVAPCHHLAGASDQIHYTNVSQRLNGIYAGRALKQLVIDRVKPDCLWPILAYARGTELRVRFRAPRFPLVIDTAALGTIADNGWKVIDDTGTLALSSIAVSPAGDEIIMSLNRTLGSNPLIRYALDYVSSIASLTLDAGGNLHDSTREATLISGIARPLWHVAPAFQMAVTKLEVQP